MPQFLEDKLKREYAGKGLKGRRLQNAIYGTLNNIGAMHGSKETAKGRAMERKHQRKVNGFRVVRA